MPPSAKRTPFSSREIDAASAGRAESQGDPARAYARRLLRDCGLTTQRVETSMPDERHVGPSAALEWARSGAMILTGEPEAPPRFAAGPVASAAAGAGLALSALAPVPDLARLDAAALLGERAALAGLERRGRISAGGSARFVATRDGCIVVNLSRDEDWRSIAAWLECDALGGLDRADERERWRALESMTVDVTSRHLVDRGRLLGLAITDAPRRIERASAFYRLEAASQAEPANPQRPIRLLDLSSLWAGPLASSLLGLAGFEVLKVESPGRPDGARLGPAAFFDLMNGGKDGCALDLRASRDRSLFERLLDRADVVLESARPRALEQLGYAAADWVGQRSGRLWVSLTGYGRAAPMRDWIAYGDDAAVAAGLGWSLPAGGAAIDDADAPCFCADAVADPLAGLHAAVATLAHHRAGIGGVLDVALFDVARYAAGFEAGALTAPIERRDAGWQIVVNGARHAIAPPRARTGNARAPALASPTEVLADRWTRAC